MNQPSVAGVRAGLQIAYLGFVAPTALLILDGVLILVAAWLRRGEGRA